MVMSLLCKWGNGTCQVMLADGQRKFGEGGEGGGGGRGGELHHCEGKECNISSGGGGMGQARYVSNRRQSKWNYLHRF